MNQKNNMQFCLLSALGSFMVVDGHLNGSFLDIGGLMQYYFFHMPMFVFISGYFYKGCEDSIIHYTIHKFKRLMVPYFIWNLIYGILAQFLRNYGFAFGEPVTWFTLFVEPFRMGYQFIFNHVAWFVPTLFLIEVINAVLTNLIRRLSGQIFSSPQKALNHEVFIQTGLYLLISLGGIYISRHFRTEGFLLMAVRVMFLLLFYSAGCLYRKKLEVMDTIKSVYYFPVLLCIAMLLAWSGQPLIYGLWNCRDFPGYVLPYITAFMGIAFWLRAARILTPAFQDSTLIQFWGRNTYAIMMHHMMVLFLIKTLYACFASFSGLFQAFDFTAYQTDFYYCYLPRGIAGFRVFYLLAGIGVPLGFQWFQNKFLFYLNRHIRWHRQQNK